MQRSHNLMVSFHDRLRKFESSDKNQELSETVDKLEQLLQQVAHGKELKGDPSTLPSYSRVPPPAQQSSPPRLLPEVSASSAQ